MALLDDIASGGTARPLAAFLVGRENRRQRIRQENIDAQAQATAESQNELRAAQTERLRNPIQQPVDTFRVATPEERKAANVPETSFAQINTRTKEMEVKHAPRALVQNTVNSGNPAEDAGTEIFLKDIGARASERNQLAFKTFESDAVLDRISLSLAQGASSGFGEDTILTLRSAAETLGIADLPEGAREGEVMRSLTNRLALQARNPESGLGLPGNTSNRDLDFLLQVVPGLQKTEGGNELVIDFMKRTNKLARDVAAEQNRLFVENGNKIPGDLDSKLITFVNNYDIFTPEEREQIKGLVATNQTVGDRFIEPESARDLPGFDSLSPEDQADLLRLEGLQVQ